MSDGNINYLFSCSFDETEDPYPYQYNVYVMPQLDAPTLAGSWIGIEELATEFLGKVAVPVTAVEATLKELLSVL